MGLDFPQSIPICAAFAGVGGILEVFATAVLAYPAAKMAQGHPWSDTALQLCLAMNIFLQIAASLAGNLFATWYGPVSVVGPIFFAAQLLANLIIYYVVLGIEAFSKEMRIGTYIIALAVTMLLANGPTAQDYGDTDLHALVSEVYAASWLLVLLASMTVTGGIVVWTAKLSVENFKKRSVEFRIAVLLIARASSFAINLSTGKAMVLETTQGLLVACIVLKIMSGMIYTMAIVVQSTTVPQKVFVPMNAATAIFVNAITGMLVWRDYRVVQSWVGYVGVFMLLVLGCNLLLGDLQLLQETSPELFRGNRVGLAFRETRQAVLEEIKQLGQQNSSTSSDQEEDDDGVDAELDLDDLQQGHGKDTTALVNTSTNSAGLHHHHPPTLTTQQEAWAKIFERAKAVPRHAVAERTLHYDEDGVIFFLPTHVIPPALRGGAGRRQQRIQERLERSGISANGELPGVQQPWWQLFPPRQQQNQARGGSPETPWWHIFPRQQPRDSSESRGRDESSESPPWWQLPWLLHPQTTSPASVNDNGDDDENHQRIQVDEHAKPVDNTDCKSNNHDEEQPTATLVRGTFSSMGVGQFGVQDEDPHLSDE